MINILGQIKKKFVWRELMNRWSFHEIIHHFMWYCWVTTKNKWNPSFCRSPFSGENYNWSSWFWWDKLFSNTINLLSHSLSIIFFYWTLFPLFLFLLRYLSTQFCCLLTCLSLTQPWMFCKLPFILFRSFCFL